MAFDKALMLKFGWLDTIIEKAIVQGILPIPTAFVAGMIGTDQKLKDVQIKMLIDMAIKLGYTEKK